MSVADSARASRLSPSVDWLESIDPATGTVVGRVEVTPVDQIPGRVAAAQRAARAWGAVAIAERVRILREAAPALAAAVETIGTLASREMGKPLPEGRGEAKHAASVFAADVESIGRSLAPTIVEDERTRSTMRFDPLGVAAVITPWNFPVSMPQESVLPALVAGNAVVLKPSEETPLTADAWAAPIIAALTAAGHPEVLQVVHGDERQGRALVRSEVQLVVFTGSRAAGADILEAAGPGFKRVILELGGKDPLIVLEDADLEAASTFATRNCFRNAGQVCVGTERIYVAKPVAARFTELLVEKARALKQGPCDEAGVQVGPMVHGRQKAMVLRQVEDAVKRGAALLLGGAGSAGDHGNYVPPTVLANLDHSMPIMREETFGPVACVMTVAGDDEAVECANDSPYGLGGAVFGSPDRAEAVAARLATAMVGINRSCGGAEGTPWVGARHSGYGYRGGVEGDRQFAQVRVISRSKPPTA